MESEMISRENIKPSLPTPVHLETYKLSLLDQIMLPSFFPIVLYYTVVDPSPNKVEERIQVLKQSLSLNLTQFYPFSGIIKDPLSVDCNDQGVPFTVAKVKGKLSDFLNKPDLQLNTKYLPEEHVGAPGTHVCKIQVNQFACGGFTIGMIVAHQVVDAVTAVTFLRSWAAIAHGSLEAMQQPSYVGQSLFPQKDTMQMESYLFYDMISYVKPARYTTKRFVFNSSAIDTLKAISKSTTTPIPSRVQALSAFLWKCFMAAAGDHGTQDTFLLNHAVNMRRRAKPSIPENCFGNFVWMAPSQSIYNKDTNLKDLVTKVSEAISELDDSFIMNLQENGYHECLEQTRKRMPKEVKYLGVSSWCNFGLYDIDFGCGKPAWISGANYTSDMITPAINMIVLMDTRDGSGVEAWMLVEEQWAEALENNVEIRNFRFVDPNHALNV